MTKFFDDLPDKILFSLTPRELWLARFERYADNHRIAHQKLVSGALQTLGRYDLLPKIRGAGDVQLSTLERFDEFYREYPDGPPDKIKFKLRGSKVYPEPAETKTHYTSDDIERLDGDDKG